MVAALDGGGHAGGSPTLVSPLGWGEGGVVWGPAIPVKDPTPQLPVGSPTVTTPPAALLTPPPRSTPPPVLAVRHLREQAAALTASATVGADDVAQASRSPRLQP